MANTHKKHWLSQKRWRVVLAVVLAILLFISVRTVYLNRQIAEEKKAFDASFVEVQKRADRLSAEFQPTSREDTKRCDYSSAKFSKGSLGCGVNVTMQYSDISVEQANKLVKQNSKLNIGGTIKSNSIGTIKDVPYFYKLSPDEKSRSVNQELKQPFQGPTPKCGMFFTYKEAVSTLLVSFGCFSGAKAEHYPVVE